ncbi:hypothetical protein Q765_10700 [Flavobacterium rivuli WB 3.3-2 = DSM 21788]|uniref:NACHT domain-containing protein n=1 Tax=Flavobacterium rivuli WB 3.3-2 = DSM 21788 TaxID=1121895 RepID=A0A0A2M4G2_9FLAO|nr:NACHT domain-containing protein [Flavobacterium rivuli]KGO86348.1 hypothetical protein Q765_10700 [Flavobacterium rivuli WB 3.3-2 = DSM 21788]
MEIKLKSSDYNYKLNFKEVVKNFFDFNVGSAITDMISIDSSIEMKAFTLLYNTAKTTITELVKELDQDKVNLNSDISINREIENELKSFLELEITITPDFFEDIINHNPDYLKKSYLLFKKYLRLLKIEIPESFEYSYYKTFRSKLSEEYHNNRSKYDELQMHFNNPVREQNIKMDALFKYYSDIKTNFILPLRQDGESNETLKDLYIDPYFKVYSNNLSFTTYYQDFFEFRNESVTAHEFINEYFLQGKAHPDLKKCYNMLFLLGQPGQGKTSLCYKVVYDILINSYGLPNQILCFVKIRDLVASDFINTPFDEINKYLKTNYDFNNSKVLLILDGLDEAYMGGGISDNDLRNLYDRLNKTCRSNVHLKIILTSRLSYLNANEACIDGSLVIKLESFSDRQIGQYVKKFKLFYPQNNFIKKVSTILKDNQYSHIKELLKQAVVIYFIAIADIDVESGDSKSIIYDKLFSVLSKRGWDRNGQLDYIKSKVKSDHILYEKYLREYIRNIAFEVYQSPKLYITLTKLAGLDSTNNFVKKCFNDDLINSPEKLKDISKYLLISFYFQESTNNTSSDTAIEFFHNSLWEYLTAEYLWEENKKILLKKDEDGDFLQVTNEQYFEHLRKMIGNKTLSYAVYENLVDIISHEDDDIKILIAEQSDGLFLSLLNDDFILEYRKKDDQISAVQKSISIFELFWTFYYKSNLSRGNVIEVSERLEEFLFSFTFMFSAEYVFENLIFANDPTYIRYSDSNEYLDCHLLCDFTSCDLSNNVFEDCIIRANFSSCFIQRNKFIQTEFEGSEFYKNNVITDNFFANCTFSGVKFESPESFKWFLEKNNFNYNILDSYVLVPKEEKRYDGTNQINYYLVIK